jgi:preprotein translocase subunit SecD
MTIKSSLYVLLFWASAALSDDPARLVLSSAIDFTHVSLVLKAAENPDPDYVEVTVTLTPEAGAKAKSITLLAYQKYMTLYVDGYQLSTSKVQGTLGGSFKFEAPRALVIEWMSQFSRGAIVAQPTR